MLISSIISFSSMESQCYANACLSGLWISTVGIYTWGDASRSHNRRVVALIAREREDVLHREIDAQTFNNLATLWMEVIAQCEVVELQVVTLLKEIAADDSSTRLDVGEVCVGSANHIVGTTSFQAHAIFTHIENLEA